MVKTKIFQRSDAGADVGKDIHARFYSLESWTMAKWLLKPTKPLLGSNVGFMKPLLV